MITLRWSSSLSNWYVQTPTAAFLIPSNVISVQALSNQSSLLLNRTTRAAARENARRASTFPHTSVPSPARQTSNHSAPDRYNSVTILPRHLRNEDSSFERPASYSHSRSASYRSGSHKSDIPLDADEESDESLEPEDQDESDDEPQLVKESPSFETFQPYPRDVSIEPSPDPAQEGFSASVPVYDEQERQEEEGPRHIPRRMDSDRKLDHERLLVELEERLNIEPSRRRARSGASATSTATLDAARSEGVVRPSLGLAGSQSMAPKSSGVNMVAARGMLDAMFAKRAAAGGRLGPEVEAEEEEEEEEEEDDYEEEVVEDYESEGEIHVVAGSFDVRDVSVIGSAPVALDYDSEPENEQPAKGGALSDARTPRSNGFLVHDGVSEDGTLESDRTFDGHKILEGGIPLEVEQTPWAEEDDEERQGSIGVAISTPERQQTQGDDLGLGSQSSPDDQSFLPADWDIGSLDLDAHPLDLDVRLVDSDRHVREPVVDLESRELERDAELHLAGGELDRDDDKHLDLGRGEHIGYGGHSARDFSLGVDEHHDHDGRLDRDGYSDHDAHSDLDRHQDLDEHSIHDESPGRDGLPESYLIPHDTHSGAEEHSGSEHESSDGFLSDDEPMEDYTELVEGQAVVTSSVVLRREIPRETSLPEIEAVRIMSRMGSRQNSTKSKRESLVEIVPEEHSVEEEPENSVGEVSESLVEVDPESLVEAVSGKMVRAETVSASSVVFELPRVEPALLVPALPGSPAERTHSTTLDLQESVVGGHETALDSRDTPLGDVLRIEPQDFDDVTPTATRSPEPQSSVPAPPVPEARAMSISNEPRSEAEPSKRRSQLKPLRLSILYGLKSPSSITITPNSASPTPVASTFAPPAPQLDPSTGYPTPATAHPTHAGSGTARSIPSSSNPRSVPSLADVEEASEGISVHGVGRGSFGPESVSWFGSKTGSTRGSLGDSMRRSVIHARTPESVENAPSSPTRSQPRRLTNPLSEFTAPPEDEDVRPLPVIWDDETDADSRSASRNGSGSDVLARSPSIPIPVFDVPMDDRTPTAATIAERMGSLPRYPAFVSVEGSSPRASEGRRSPLPSPRLMNSARASPESESVPGQEQARRKRAKPLQEPEPAWEVEVTPAVESEREVKPIRAAEPRVEPTLGLEPMPEAGPVPKVEPLLESAPRALAIQTETARNDGPSQEMEATGQAGLIQEAMETTSEAVAKPNPPTRTRKWGDQTDEESIGSLPVFDEPAPVAQTTPEPQGDSVHHGAPVSRTDRLGRPRYVYPPLPDTAPLSISPRNVTPSMMQMPEQQEQDQAQDQDQDQEPYFKRIPWATPPLTAPLHLQMKMRAQQGETAPSPWMAEHFVNSPSSLHSSQLGSMHSASSSVTTPDNVPIFRQFNGAKEYPARTSSLLAKSFGDPGPGPSTMMTYSARQQSAEGLGSPILLQSPPHSRVASLVDESSSFNFHARSTNRGTSREDSTSSYGAELIQPDDEPTVKVLSEEPNIVPSSSARSASTRHVQLQSPLRSTMDELPTSAQSLRFKPSSPTNSRSPRTPLPAHSPLQILRRNLMTRPGSVSPGFPSPQSRSTNLPESRSISHQHHGSLAPPMSMRHDDLHNAPKSAPLHRDRRSLTPAARFGGGSRPGSPTLSTQSVISQTKPLLFFAIAKNSAQEVERLLQEGEVQPNDKAGPDDLPALAFALSNEQLSDKTQIVKSLLSHGADPASVLHRKSGSGVFDDAELALSSRIEQGINPAIRYYLNRKRMTIPALQADLLEKNNFGALTRAGFSIIGQDSALDELIRVVAGHCRRQTLNPLVIVFSGGPGCGKSLLASKIGPLLHVPYFTVNMTNLRNESSLFQYISMTTKPGSPQIPLADFLKVNEGQRCVVVLEEIEKAADKTVWYVFNLITELRCSHTTYRHSLLMPWEWDKATIISPTTNEQIDIDTTKVIWIATSNSGDDATLKFFAERSRPSPHAAPGESALARLVHSPRPKDNNFTRKDYLQLMQAVRKRLGELLGSSMISRVSSVLPFLPFTEEEVLALASESLSAMRESQKLDQDPEDVDWDELLQQAVREYIPGEGARSVHRAIQRAYDEITEW
ncbi:hypothetical protein FRC12_001112 [Ceratobasidium sp. 428]|nr:hypothetical protein FRC12_001112 [Ceratobasidium sp. 428]